MADVAATPVSGSEEVPAAIRTMRWFIRHPPAVTFLLVVIVCIVVGTINPDFWQVSNLFDMHAPPSCAASLRLAFSSCWHPAGSTYRSRPLLRW